MKDDKGVLGEYTTPRMSRRPLALDFTVPNRFLTLSEVNEV